jgi:catechol 2,3-dioxygenase-like lactoylglutathione lyase family enzyme
MQPIDPGIRKLAQVALVCRDIHAAIARWSAVLGVPPPAPITTEPGLQRSMTFRGVPSDARCHLAFFDLGGVQLELIQPLGGESSWQEGLDRNGEGFHHLGFWVEDVDRAKAGLAAQGAPELHAGKFQGGGYVYVESAPSLGVTLELLYREPKPASAGSAG